MKPPYLLIGGALVFKVLVLFVLVPALSNFASAHYSLGFADDYDILAKSLASGQGYRLGPDFTETMMREPGYPLALAVTFKLLGYGIESARIANLLLASAAALLLWHLALRVSRHATVSVVAVVIFLLHPGIVIAEARGGVEILFICALLAFMLLLFRAIEADRAQHYFLAGLALGAVILVRSTPLLFPVVLLPYLLLTAPQGAKRRRLAQWALLVAGMGFVMSPWIARNNALSGQFVPTGTVQGVAAQEGQYTCERLWSGRDFQDLQQDAAAQRNRIASQIGLRFQAGYYQYFYTVADETAFNRALMQQTVARYRDDPVLLARCAGANLFHFWFLGKNAVATALNVGMQLPLLALALTGVFVLARRRPAAAWAPLALFVTYVVAVHLPIIAHARHGIPLVPFLGVFAAAALVAAWQRLSAGRRATPGLPWLRSGRDTRPPQTA